MIGWLLALLLTGGDAGYTCHKMTDSEYKFAVCDYECDKLEKVCRVACDEFSKGKDKCLRDNCIDRCVEKSAACTIDCAVAP